jgi:hypothetical protein
VRIPKGLRLAILEVLQINGLWVGNLGQNTAKHGKTRCWLGSADNKALSARIKERFGGHKDEIQAEKTKEPASEGGRYKMR